MLFSRVFVVLLALALGLVYVFPNFYGDYPALTLRSADKINEIDLLKAQSLLKEKELTHRAVYMASGQVNVLFDDEISQKAAVSEFSKNLLQEGYSVNSALLKEPSSFFDNLGVRPMFLGLDLRGGVHFLIQVSVEDVLEKVLSSALVKAQKILESRDILVANSEIKDSAIIIEVSEASISQAYGELLRTQNGFANEFEVSYLPGASNKLLLSVDSSYLKSLQDLAVEQNISTLRNRVGELGIEQPIVQRQGFDRIVVELAGVQDVASARKILGSVAVIEFHLLNEQYNQNNLFVPTDTKLYLDQRGQEVAVYRDAVVTGEEVVNAVASFDQQNNSPVVSINLNSEGGRKMLETTKKNIGKYMAVLYKEVRFEDVIEDGKLVQKKRKKEVIVSTARIRSEFSDRFQIEGLDGLDEARQLAIFLRSGSLATSLNILQERIIGPSLGQKNIENGLYAVLFGLFLVLVFMMLRYRLMGAVANFALLLNIVLMVALLSALQATLTLPGIAGILLTVGIAVDANVIIFEKMREQIKEGLSVMRCIENGYREALSAIVDANITTFIAALVLFFLGSGPVKGFAVTLAIGILTSVFTAVFATKVLLDLFMKYRPIKKLSI